ncbi:putative amino acid permease YfnA [Phytophthora cinnamomi]|uniref:putative amino acid permease YfnA n=1 Tax=Phytophthora cinnamomi TaxID=4785 RepID=UPI00355AB51C|nr:putative amino acid permease YfnA [Phytophthora cinnamomi]
MLEDHVVLRSTAPKVTFYIPREDTAPAAAFVDLKEFDKEAEMIEQSPSLYDQRQTMTVNHRRLGVVGIVSILYVYLCAGPIGSETVISSAGPLIGLLGFLLYALFVAFPFAYIVAELCSAFPEDGGFTVWVLNAFGPFWAFQVGYWSWIAGVLRGALMPSTVLTLLTRYYGVEVKSSVAAYFIKAAIGVALAIPTFLGTRTVGRLSFVVVSVVILFFSVFTVWSFANASNFHDIIQVRREKVLYDPVAKDVVSTGDLAIEWATLLNTLFFKFKGINNASVFGGEVQNPARSYARAIGYTCLLVLVTYIVPMIAGIGTDALPWFLLDRDAFPFFAYFVGGSSLRTLIQIATCCGSAGMCMAAVHVKTFLVSGMAENRLLPKVLAKRHPKFQSPYNAALLTLVLMLALINLDFHSMLVMTNAYSAAVQLLIIATIIKLRRELPYIARPTKVPGGVPVLYAIAVIPTFMFGYVTFYACCNLVSAILMVAFFVPGVLYAGYRFIYRR